MSGSADYQVRIDYTPELLSKLDKQLANAQEILSSGLPDTNTMTQTLDSCLLTLPQTFRLTDLIADFATDEFNVLEMRRTTLLNKAKHLNDKATDDSELAQSLDRLTALQTEIRYLHTVAHSRSDDASFRHHVDAICHENSQLAASIFAQKVALAGRKRRIQKISEQTHMLQEEYKSLEKEANRRLAEQQTTLKNIAWMNIVNKNYDDLIACDAYQCITAKLSNELRVIQNQMTLLAKDSDEGSIDQWKTLNQKLLNVQGQVKINFVEYNETLADLMGRLEQIKTTLDDTQKNGLERYVSDTNIFNTIKIALTQAESDIANHDLSQAKENATKAESRLKTMLTEALDNKLKYVKREECEGMLINALKRMLDNPLWELNAAEGENELTDHYLEVKVDDDTTMSFRLPLDFSEKDALSIREELSQFDENDNIMPENSPCRAQNVRLLEDLRKTFTEESGDFQVTDWGTASKEYEEYRRSTDVASRREDPRKKTQQEEKNRTRER